MPLVSFIRGGSRVAALLAALALAACSTSRRDRDGALDEPSRRSSCAIPLGPAGLGGGAAGAEGSQAGAGGSSGGAAGAPMSGDDFVSDVAVSVHPKVNTVLVVGWNQRI